MLLVVIAFTGYAANFALYLFHSVILGWKDGAPEWYIEIQNWVIYGIFVASAVFWTFVAYRRYARRKNNPEMQNV